MMTLDYVPQISLKGIDFGALKTQPTISIASEMHAYLRDIGFIYIVDHGIDEKMIAKIFTYSRAFFDQPISSKNELRMEQAGKAWRGYFPLGGELTSGRPDQKEGLYFGKNHSNLDKGCRLGWPLHGQNQYPKLPDKAEWARLVESYIRDLNQLGQNLMQLIALALGLDAHYFLGRFSSEPTTLFRIFNYPAHTWQDSEDEWGVREHTDMGFLTILRQDRSGGLEVSTRDGQWIPAPPKEGSFVINIGDMLELWTRGVYRATPHRVRNLAKGDRLSLPFFFDPNWEASLEPIPRSLLRSDDLNRIEDTNERWDKLDLSSLTKDSTYGDFVWSKVSRVFPNLKESN